MSSSVTDTLKRSPMPHQRRALSFIRRRPRPRCAVLFMRPGTGKTLVAIRAARTPTLIICRRDDFLTWELELTAEGALPYDMEFINSSRNIGAYLQRDALPPYTIITYDLVKNEEVHALIAIAPFRSVIADECHMIMHSSSERHRKVISATRHIPERLGLTGTPINNKVLNVFGQMLFIDDGETLGSNEWKFRNRYYLRAKVGKQAQAWFPKRTAKDQIAAKLQDIAFHVHEDDVLKLPPVSSIIKACPPSGQQRRYSEEVLVNWELTIDSPSQPLELDYVVQQVAKLRQIASGFFYYPRTINKRAIRWLKCPKLDLLASMLSEGGELEDKPKVVVWAVHDAEIRRISKTLNELDSPISNVLFSGKLTPTQRREARLRFKSKRGPRVFISQADMGVGMNELVVADTAIYYSNSYRVSSRQQSKARIRRKGSEIHKTITYYDLLTEGSIDTTILQSLKSNIKVADYIMQRLKAGTPLRKILASRTMKS